MIQKGDIMAEQPGASLFCASQAPDYYNLKKFKYQYI
jgi:hypothetical protein